MPHWTERLLPKDACEAAVEWCRTQKTPSAAWENCTNPSWMFWLLGRKDAGRKKLVLAACGCARLALKHTKDPRVLTCIETTEAWAKGKATIERVNEVRRAASAAYAAAYADAADAAYAASAAAYAARGKTQAKCADIIRKHFPKPSKL